MTTELGEQIKELLLHRLTDGALSAGQKKHLKRLCRQLEDEFDAKDGRTYGYTYQSPPGGDNHSERLYIHERVACSLRRRSRLKRKGAIRSHRWIVSPLPEFLGGPANPLGGTKQGASIYTALSHFINGVARSKGWRVVIARGRMR